MAYAIFKTRGKQYRVQVGDVLSVDRIEGAENDAETTFDQVLLVSDGGQPAVGSPLVQGATVTAKVLEAREHGRKGVAFKFKRRKGFHKKLGFRAALTKIEITAINA
ncbi:MAG: 50S ribosomal protein L21 [Akkermansiaceae bacterium]|nr:50S ribosomal protein L21 [Akkermansiaceae bacterium]MCD8070566.1 50S ribosomal protein L21 [Akkermansiaceae bacterium]